MRLHMLVVDVAFRISVSIKQDRQEIIPMIKHGARRYSTRSLPNKHKMCMLNVDTLSVC